MSDFLTKTEELKVIYKEIIDGSSFIDEESLFLKHFSDLESSELAKVRVDTYNKQIKDGLPSESERVSQLIKNEEWTPEKEDDILSYRLQIADNKKNIANIIPQQKHLIQKVIDDTQEKLNNLLYEKRSILGFTANDIAEREGMYFYISSSFFLDKHLQNKKFPNNVDNLEVDEIERLIFLIENNLRKFSEENIKRVSVLSFFINPFSYSKDNISIFFGKPVSQLTSFQLALVSFGSRNLSILSNSKGSPPELLNDNINDIVLWYDSNYSVLAQKHEMTD